MFGKYSFLNMLKVYKDNHVLINAKLQGKTIEGYTGTDDEIMDLKGLGMITFSFFMFLFLITGIIYIWAVVITVKYWKDLSDIARVFAILGLFGLGGPVVTIIIVYVSKGSGNSAKLIANGSGYNFRFR